MKVITNQINEIHISHFQKTSLENLTKSETITQQPILFWCKGYVFSLSCFESEELTVKKTKGTWYIDSLVYSKSEKINQSKFNGFSVEVIDQTGDQTLERLFDYISKAEK